MDKLPPADTAAIPSTSTADSSAAAAESTRTADPMPSAGERTAPVERRSRGSRAYSKLEFGYLRSTKDEALDVEDDFFRRFATDGGEAHVRFEAEATCEALIRLAPQGRYLHLATHAYVEDQTIPCITDLRHDEDGDELLMYLSDRRSEARGLSPMSICGVALAGSNLRDP